MLKPGQFGIRQILWLTGAAAASALFVRLNFNTAFFVALGWISFLAAIVTRHLGWKTRSTILFIFLMIDVLGGALLAYASWVVRADPQSFPGAILLGNPIESFFIGLFLFAPLATAFAFAACYAFVLVDGK